MKRTPMVRKTPMRSTSQLKRSRIRPVSKNKKPGVTDEVAQAVKRRSGGICERCKIKPGTDLHHRVTRARGGPHDEFVLCHLCSECHHVHAHGMNEYPWLVPGFFLDGKYIGTDAEFRRRYPGGMTR